MNQTPHFSIQEGVFLIYSLNRDKERVRLMNLLKQKEFWLFSHLCCKVRSLTNVENSFQKLFSDIKLYTLRIVLAQTPYEASYKKNFVLQVVFINNFIEFQHKYLVKGFYDNVRGNHTGTLASWWANQERFTLVLYERTWHELSTISTIMPSNLQELICSVSIVIIPIL